MVANRSFVSENWSTLITTSKNRAHKIQACERHTNKINKLEMHAGLSEDLERQASNKMESSGSTRTAVKLAIVTLAANNENQAEWLTSVRNYAREKNIMHLMMKQHQRYRDLRASDLDNSVRAINSAKESNNGSSSSSNNDQNPEAKEAASTEDKQVVEATAVKTEHGTTTGGQVVTNLTEMDDFENLFMSKMVIFLDSTGANEGAKASKARFGFSTQLSMSTPHHRAKLVTWIEGDI